MTYRNILVCRLRKWKDVDIDPDEEMRKVFIFIALSCHYSCHSLFRLIQHSFRRMTWMMPTTTRPWTLCWICISSDHLFIFHESEGHMSYESAANNELDDGTDTLLKVLASLYLISFANTWNPIHRLWNYLLTRQPVPGNVDSCIKFIIQKINRQKLRLKFMKSVELLQATY